MADNKVTRLTPVPDNIEGVNIPYRGSVDHGVEPEEFKPLDETTYHEGREVEYEAEQEVVTPIPVRIVNQGGREIKGWNVSNHIVPDFPVAIAGRSDNRTSLKIVNESESDSIWIGPTSTISSYAGGYRIGPGKDISLVTQEPVYAVCAVADGVVVGVLAEHTEAVK